MSYIKALESKKIAVVGGGVTGGAVLDFLTTRGISADLFDDKSFGAKRGVESKYDLAIVSPGWRSDHEILMALRDDECELLSEIDFAWLIKEEISPEQKWIALTGTNGKTTTIQMIQSIFDYSSKSGLACGNVGEPVISVFASAEKYDFLALELSSFQLEWSHLARYEAVALLNIAPDHIDWHGSFDSYALAKLKILEASKVAIINGEDSESVLRSSSWLGKKIFYFLDIPQVGELGLVENLLVDRAFTSDPGQAIDFAELSDIRPTVPHNVANAMAAAGLTLAIGITHDEIRSGLKNFRLDRHRLELLLEHDGITWVNDSKATNPHAASAALMSHISSIWIAGGLAKGAEMAPLVERCASRIKAAILIGQDATLIATALSKCAPQIPYFILPFTGDSEELMREVVSKAQELAQSGDTVLLAPACASMDQFEDYADRGEKFIAAVREVVGLS
jgi:UDP-N-acetylmuramoylalanine--D-glutamate ligase